LDEGFRKAIQSTESLTQFVKAEYDQIYSCDFLDVGKGSKVLIEQFEALEKQSRVVSRNASLEQVDSFVGLLDMLVDIFLTPLALVFFPDCLELKSHNSFVIKYTPEENGFMQTHVDDSDLTFNICLGDGEFTGSELYFVSRTKVGSKYTEKEEFSFQHKPGSINFSFSLLFFLVFPFPSLVLFFIDLRTGFSPW